MKRISSGMTFLMKKFFPVFWFGILILATIGIGIGYMQEGGSDLAIVIVAPVIMAIIGFLIFRQLIFDLVDEVWDAGDTLVVRNGPAEIRFPFSDIEEVYFSNLSNPQRVTITLRNQTQLGTKIAFLAPTRWINLGRHPLETELVQRAEAARPHP